MRPVFISSLLFGCGIIAASFLKTPFIALYMAAAILYLFVLLNRNKSLFVNLLIALVFVLGMLWFTSRNILSNNHISKPYFYTDKQTCLVKGRVRSEPQTETGKAVLLLESRAIKIRGKTFKCNGLIQVYTNTNKKLAYGDELVLSGKIYRPFSSQNYANYLKMQGVYRMMSARVVSQEAVRLNILSFLKRHSLEIKSKIEQCLYQHLSPVTAAIADAMILGEKKNVPRPIYKSMMNTGTVHILVVSGSNVGIVAFLVDLLLKLVRVSRRRRILIILPVLLIYCFMTGTSNPVVRATVMATILLAGVLIKRDADIYNSLGIAALFILTINPNQLFDIGFQLSFLSVLSIAFFYSKLRIALHLQIIKNKILIVFTNGLLVSVSAWLGTLVPIAVYFKTVSPVTVLANILIVPLASLITLCGFVLAITGGLNLQICRQFALACELLVSVMLGINSVLLRIPAAHLYFGRI